jgi:hypothetical protein
MLRAFPIARWFRRHPGRGSKAWTEHHSWALHLFGIDDAVAIAIEVQCHLMNGRSELFERQNAVQIPIEVIERRLRVEGRMTITWAGPITMVAIAVAAGTAAGTAMVHRTTKWRRPSKWRRTTERRRADRQRMGKLVGIEPAVMIGIGILETPFEHAVDLGARDTAVFVEIEFAQQHLHMESAARSGAATIEWRRTSGALFELRRRSRWRRRTVAALFVVGQRRFDQNAGQQADQQ